MDEDDEELDKKENQEANAQNDNINDQADDMDDQDDENMENEDVDSQDDEDMQNEDESQNLEDSGSQDTPVEEIAEKMRKGKRGTRRARQQRKASQQARNNTSGATATSSNAPSSSQTNAGTPITTSNPNPNPTPAPTPAPTSAGATSAGSATASTGTTAVTSTSAGATGAGSATASAGATGTSSTAGCGAGCGVGCVIILIIFLLIGFIAFLFNMPDSVWSKINEWWDDTWLNSKVYWADSVSEALAKTRVEETAQYLENMGFDLVGYGFLDETENNDIIYKYIEVVKKGSDNWALKGTDEDVAERKYSSNPNASAYYLITENISKIWGIPVKYDKNEIGFRTNETIISTFNISAQVSGAIVRIGYEIEEENGTQVAKIKEVRSVLERNAENKIIYVDSRPLLAYLAAEERTYMFKGQYANFKEWWQGTWLKDFSLKQIFNIKDDLSNQEYTREGMLKLNQGVLDSYKDFKDYEYITGQKDENGNAITEGLAINIDREKRVLSVPITMKTFAKYFNLPGRVDEEVEAIFFGAYKYNLVGWTGKYGKPIEFSLALHLATMSPEFTYNFVTDKQDKEDQTKQKSQSNDNEKSSNSLESEVDIEFLKVPYSRRLLTSAGTDAQTEEANSLIESVNSQIAERETEYESQVRNLQGEIRLLDPLFDQALISRLRSELTGYQEKLRILRSDEFENMVEELKQLVLQNILTRPDRDNVRGIFDSNNFKMFGISYGNLDLFLEICEYNDLYGSKKINVPYIAAVKNHWYRNLNFGTLNDVQGEGYVVKIDEPGAAPIITDQEALKKIVETYKSQKAVDNVVDNIKAILDVQEKYKVNAIFTIAVGLYESGFGTSTNEFLNKRKNWFSIKGKEGGNPWYRKSDGSYFNSYSSGEAAIYAFGALIGDIGAGKASDTYYFGKGNYTVNSIGENYCNAHWSERVNGLMKTFYEEAQKLGIISGGLDTNSASTNAEDANAGVANADNTNPEDANAGDTSTGDAGSGDTSTGDSNASDTNAGDANAGNVAVPNFTKYNLTDKQLSNLADICHHENSTPPGVAAEASLMCNRFELHGKGKFTNLYDYVTKCRWWAPANKGKYGDKTATPEELQAVKQVIIEGKRTLPGYIDEHDYIYDITSAYNNEVSVGRDKSKYQQNVTIIKNKYGGKWTFYCFPTAKSDPFGYTDKAAGLKVQIGDGCYDLNGNPINGVGGSYGGAGGVIGVYGVYAIDYSAGETYETELVTNQKLKKGGSNFTVSELQGFDKLDPDKYHAQVTIAYGIKQINEPKIYDNSKRFKEILGFVDEKLYTQYESLGDFDKIDKTGLSEEDTKNNQKNSSELSERQQEILDRLGEAYKEKYKYYVYDGTGRQSEKQNIDLKSNALNAMAILENTHSEDAAHILNEFKQLYSDLSIEIEQTEKEKNQKCESLDWILKNYIPNYDWPAKDEIPLTDIEDGKVVDDITQEDIKMYSYSIKNDKTILQDARDNVQDKNNNNNGDSIFNKIEIPRIGFNDEIDKIIIAPGNCKIKKIEDEHLVIEFVDVKVTETKEVRTWNNEEQKYEITLQEETKDDDRVNGLVLHIYNIQVSSEIKENDKIPKGEVLGKIAKDKDLELVLKDKFNSSLNVSLYIYPPEQKEVEEDMDNLEGESIEEKVWNTYKNDIKTMAIRYGIDEHLIVAAICETTKGDFTKVLMDTNSGNKLIDVNNFIKYFGSSDNSEKGNTIDAMILNSESSIIQIELGCNKLRQTIINNNYDISKLSNFNELASHLSKMGEQEEFWIIVREGNSYYKICTNIKKGVVSRIVEVNWGPKWATDFQASGVVGGGNIIEIAKNIVTYLYNHKALYDQGGNKNIKKWSSAWHSNSAILGGIDCSTYVTWVAYEATGLDFFATYYNSDGWMANANKYNGQYWTIVDKSQAQAGDILVRSGHIEIYAGQEGGSHKAYSCGGVHENGVHLATGQGLKSCKLDSFTYVLRLKPEILKTQGG